MTEYRNITTRTTVDIRDPFVGVIPRDSEYQIEDYWINVAGLSWKYMKDTNPAARNYSQRIQGTLIPDDDNVFYGKIGALGFLIHKSELDLD